MFFFHFIHKQFCFPLVSFMDAQIPCAWTPRLLYSALWAPNILSRIIAFPTQYRRTCISSHTLSSKHQITVWSTD